MAITPEERRRMSRQRKGDRRRVCLRAVPSTKEANPATEPGFRLTWPIAVGVTIAAAIIALGAVALGNGGRVDIDIAQFIFPRVH